LHHPKTQKHIQPTTLNNNNSNKPCSAYQDVSDLLAEMDLTLQNRRGHGEQATEEYKNELLAQEQLKKNAEEEKEVSHCQSTI
jgi:hypothetical protein